MDLNKSVYEIVLKNLKESFGNDLQDINLEDLLEVSVPNNKEHGDYATNVAMKLAKNLRQPPAKIAETLVNKINSDSENSSFFSKIEIVNPGFINFTLNENLYKDIMFNIFRQDSQYGKSASAVGKTAIVEFVSANPTGPLHIGHARNAVVGDSVARMLEAIGYQVTREYYFNDAGVQMNKLGRSLKARYLQEVGEDVELPEDGYKGAYMIDIAKKLHEEKGDHLKNEEGTKIFTDYAVKNILTTIDKDLKDMGIAFDSWFTETSLYENGKVDECIEQLKAKGSLYLNDGAWWLRSSEKGDEKDRVIIKSDKTMTYLAPDIAYHNDKFKRGFDIIVNLFGADHHSYVDRLKIALDFLGHDVSKLKCIVYQMVTLLKDGEKMKISTRSGEFISIKEMVEEVGVDVIRFFFNMRSADSQMVFDWELAKDTSMNNPVYYVQYAHARLSSLFKKSQELGIEWKGLGESDLSLLSTTEEKDIILKMAQLPATVEQSAMNLEPHHLTSYVRELAGQFHQFFTIGSKNSDYRIIIEDKPELTQARLSLVYCLRIVIRNTLHILGITAPESM